ncbi:MAG: hypothetical protein IKH54_06345 [Bacilli bacterium]|nr:hypothetical protein [Bacilli bacterium]
MSNNKSKIFPFIIVIIILLIVIYLFANIEQSVVNCKKRTVNDLGIVVSESLETSLDGRKITSLNLTKTIVLPSKYLNDDKYLDYIEYTIKKSYAYLGKNKVKVSKLADRIIVNVAVDKNETVILNNIDFDSTDGLTIKINSNTKSSDVVTLKVTDSYSQGELITYMKNNGYSCG